MVGLFICTSRAKRLLKRPSKLSAKQTFAPTYVREAKKFSRSRFWRVYTYFVLRGIFFNGLRYLRRDPLNVHYVDALNRLKHKPKPSDVAVLDLLDFELGDAIAAGFAGPQGFSGSTIISRSIDGLLVKVPRYAASR